MALLSGLQGYWNLNDGTGSIALDSLSLNNGSLISGVSWNNGIIISGTSFDGTDDYINLGNNFNFDRTDPFSISLWVNRYTTTNFEGLVAKMNSNVPYNGWGLFIPSATVIRFQLRNQDSPSNQINVESSSSVPKDVWTHIVSTYSGTSLASGINIYMNGSLQTITIVTDNLTGSITNSINCNFGARDNGVGPMSGLIDEVGIWNRVLNSEEVKSLYNDGNGLSYNFKIASPGIIALGTTLLNSGLIDL